MDALTKLEVARAAVKEAGIFLKYARADLKPRKPDDESGHLDDITVGMTEIDRASRLLAAAKELVEQAENDPNAPTACGYCRSGNHIGCVNPCSCCGPQYTPPAEPVGATERCPVCLTNPVALTVGRAWDAKGSICRECEPVVADRFDRITNLVSLLPGRAIPTPPAAASESPRAKEEPGCGMFWLAALAALAQCEHCVMQNGEHQETCCHPGANPATPAKPNTAKETP